MSDALGDYAFTVHLEADYEDALERTVAALKEQGFGVVTEIDMRATMREKLDREFRKYAILGACNPSLAIRALTTEPQVGLLLPCNVIVYEDEDQAGSTVSVVDPLGMLGDVEAAGLQSVADEAHARLAKVAASLDG